MRRKRQYDFLPRGVACGTLTVGLLCCAWAWAQPQPGQQLTEPVYRVSNAKVDGNAQVAPHPLETALAMARDGLRNIQENVHDYTSVMAKRERVDGELGDYEYIFTKVRNEKTANGRIVVPFSIYMYFLKPESFKGREVIYVRGQNDDKMIAHETPNSVLSKFGSIWLNPHGAMAMKGQRYPITEAGIETLIVRLIEKGTADLQRGECDVKFFQNAKVQGRKCTMLQVLHPQQREYFEFHVARIFIDDELNVPIRYSAWTWPDEPGRQLSDRELIEEYTYTQLKLNVGLTDADFDPKNQQYNF